MANPQCENGFTKIANELLDELVKASLLGAELQICLFIIRKTYGFGKMEDSISLSQFESAINKSRPTVTKSLKNLQLVNIVKLVKTGNSKRSSNIYRLNKDYETWQLGNRSKLVKFSYSTSKENVEKLVKASKHTKERTKENTKEIYSPAFLSFYSAYPKKVAKDAAWKAWKKRNGTMPEISIILNAINQHKKSADWMKDNGQFIPHPASWINQGRWQDELKTGIIATTNSHKDDFTWCKKCGARRLKSDVDENGICSGRCENATAAL